MKVRYLAYIAILVTAAVWADTAWSAPTAKPATPPTHAYVVRQGDGGWWKLAHGQGVTLAQLLAANHATTATPLRVGQTIRMPAPIRDAAKHAKHAPKKPVKH